MKIIKQGNLEQLKKIKHFICARCGCEFEADTTEYKQGNQYNETYYYMKCPTNGCENMAYVKS